jgi:hypothetical protein
MKVPQVLRYYSPQTTEQTLPLMVILQIPPLELEFGATFEGI